MDRQAAGHGALKASITATLFKYFTAFLFFREITEDIIADEVAVLSGGCWCTRRVLTSRVTSANRLYRRPHANPPQQFAAVTPDCRGDPHHLRPTKRSRDLLDIFFAIHDPNPAQPPGSASAPIAFGDLPQDAVQRARPSGDRRST